MIANAASIRVAEFSNPANLVVFHANNAAAGTVAWLIRRAIPFSPLRQPMWLLRFVFAVNFPMAQKKAMARGRFPRRRYR